ncbi:MAG: MarC family protein [Deltaproteobacteria bacterium]|nr:MarC family protein [Deltaproteobacteria bacterium]
MALIALQTIAYVFTALFPVVNPVGTALVIFGVTGSLRPDEGKTLARKISIYSFILLLFFFFFGQFILDFFGISIPVVQTAGGSVLALMGWKLLNAPTPEEKTESDPAEFKTNSMRNSFYPFTFPLTVGPGCLAVCLTLGVHIGHDSRLPSSLELLCVITGISLICIVTYLCYSRLGFFTKRMSSSGMMALSKLLAFVVICIGVEIASTGIKHL